MQLPTTASLAVPGVLILISFLSFSSQFLFYFVEPHPLSKRQAIVFNSLVSALLVCYARTCVADPGYVPRPWTGAVDAKTDAASPRHRFCRKCDQIKPPRAHHCKTCQRCVEKMDHHCPWTANCVGHATMPHFIRFIFYAVLAMSNLQYFLYIRVMVLWKYRHFPSYLGPSIAQLTHIFLLVIANSFTLFALAILCARAAWSLGSNVTTIEGWEIERHETLVRRARSLGGYLNGPNGQRVQIKKQEFPYDIGIWKNFKQNMGTGNVLAWLWPFSASPSIQSGLDFEVNGFEDESVTWPPPDPDRVFKPPGPLRRDNAFIHGEDSRSNQEIVDAFYERQENDLRRRTASNGQVFARPLAHQRFSDAGFDDDYDQYQLESSGEEGWRNFEGETLGDFGVDEDVEFDQDDDTPLAELISRQHALKNDRKTS